MPIGMMPIIYAYIRNFTFPFILWFQFCSLGIYVSCKSLAYFRELHWIKELGMQPLIAAMTK